LTFFLTRRRPSRAALDRVHRLSISSLNAWKGFRVGLTFLILLPTFTVVSRAQSTPLKSEVSDDEYAVYNVILGNIDPPKDDAHILIFGKTLPFGCGKYSDQVPLVNDCSFLAIPPDTPLGVKELLRSQWPRMAAGTWVDFERQNATSVQVQDLFITSWKHMLDVKGTGEKAGKEWDSPDLEFFFSRVGFNPQKTQAVVYVLLFSYLENVRTGGDYFLLGRNNRKKWEIQGRVRYFDKDKSQTQ
jgi:hypothetical protein